MPMKIEEFDPKRTAILVIDLENEVADTMRLINQLTHNVQNKQEVTGN